MEQSILSNYNIDHIEIFAPMAKVFAYWHTQALGFTLTATSGPENGKPGFSSYVLRNGNIQLVITTFYPVRQTVADTDVASFIAQNNCGVKRIALQVDDVNEAFTVSVSGGAIPIKFPFETEDESGIIKEASVKLYDNSEIVFIDRSNYSGVFRPGYKAVITKKEVSQTLFSSIDHIAAEVRINEMAYWTKYVTSAIGTRLVQSIVKGKENTTGMVLNISQSADNKLTLVMAEPESWQAKSKVQQNIDLYGPGIHHLAFSTPDLVKTVENLEKRNVEFVGFSDSYYNLLRKNEEFKNIDIDALQRNGILIDKEDDTFLLQKFVKPVSDRPFFFYEIVQRVNGYSGFALKNINMLKKAEEMEIMKKAAVLESQ